MRSLTVTACSMLVFALLSATGLAQTSSSPPASRSGHLVNAAYQWGGGVPNGSYQQTCQNIRLNGNRLEARCQKKEGGSRDTSIDYRSCRGQIINDDGNLRCDTSGAAQGGYGGYWQGGLPQGSYQQTCRDARIDGDHLEARCRDKDGQWRNTYVDLRGCRGDIANNDGNLRCEDRGGWQGGGYGQGGRWGGGLPQGSYQQTCQDIRMNGDLLEARCRETDGDMRNTSINYRSCRGDILNVNGNLTCDNRSGNWQGGYGPGGRWGGGLPQGSYQQTCRDVRLVGNRMEASCQEKDGGWKNSSIDYRSCRKDIANDNGQLRCR